MTVRLGKIELKWVQALHVDDGRFTVEQHIVGQAGSIFQDVGRKPVTMKVEGFILGQEALSDMETIRAAHLKSEPMQFTADVTVGSEFTEVDITYFRVWQSAGHRDRYEYLIKLTEYTEPPAPVLAGLAHVNAGIEADSGQWAMDSALVATTLQNPSSLPGLLAESPSLAGRMDMGDLGLAITDGVADISGGDFGSILQSVGSLDASAAAELLGAVREGGSLGEIVGKMADEGLDFLEEITGIDLSEVAELVDNISGGMDILKQLKEIGGELAALAGELKELEINSILRRQAP